MDYHNQDLSPLEDYNVYDNFAFTPEDDDPASSMDLQLGADGPVLARFGVSFEIHSPHTAYTFVTNRYMHVL
jgi:hypothetical protein